MENKSESFLSVVDVTVEEAGNVILQHISFEQQEFQKIAIAGETGSGKSTLLQSIAGLVQPASGEVIFENAKVKGPREVLVAGHPGIAYLSQQYELPHSLRVEQVLRYANLLTPEAAATLYDLCRISHLLTRKTNQLSGGERQRIALAKLLITFPKLLLLDEPYSNLDVAHKKILKAVIRDIGEKLDITCILISHDPADTLSWADEIIIMKAGQILQKGAPEQIYRQPINEYAAALFGDYNLIPPAHAHIFIQDVSSVAEGKALLIRPEQFSILPEGTSTLKGTVTNITFLGSYYQLEVQLPEIVVNVKVRELKATAGDVVYLSLSSDAVSFVAMAE